MCFFIVYSLKNEQILTGKILCMINYTLHALNFNNVILTHYLIRRLEDLETTQYL